MPENKEQDDGGKIADQAGHHGGYDDRQRADRSDFEAAKNIGLAILHRSHSGSEEAGSENAEYDHHRDDLRHVAGVFGNVEQPREDEEERDGKQVAEEQDGAVAPH